MSFKFTMEPRVSFLSALLKDIYEGILKVPRFQRNLVWKRQQQRELLCSIYEGLPIGALLVWNTRLDNINTYDHIGPFLVEVAPSSTSNIYLMDGLQRLSTLYCMLLHPVDKISTKYSSENKVSDFLMYCDLSADNVENMFLFRDELTADELVRKNYLYMPLDLVFKSKELLRFQRLIPAHMETLLDRCDAVVSAFKDYKIPVIPLESDDQALVTKSFERINSRGTVMSEAHMLNALSYTDKFDLLGSLELYSEKYFEESSKWKEIDTEFVLMLLKLKLGYEIYSKETDKLAKNINDRSISEIFEAIERLAEFSSKYLNIDSPASFPYRLQMLGIARSFLDDPKCSPQLLVSWFYISAYTNAFGTTARNSQRALTDLYDYLKEGSLSWSLNQAPALLALEGIKVNLNAGRIKTWVLALAAKLDASNFELYKGRDKRLVPVRPKEFIKFERRPGFYFLLGDKSDQKFSIGRMSDIEADAHFVTPELLELYESNNFNEFARIRESLMFAWEVENLIQPSVDLAKFVIESGTKIY
ncbi:DUF262 domain-containing protein [Pseudomonas azotoformans]|uniref:GmrSD restriction endonucleases N-terminal domain-containing protein n=1 Tax=Pseudomonas azotoformans TaxID=47878 RepID=A0A127HR53_PSEAZ|nr:DUF262 domain-containing protein [Pseudomonas azotoformans]AMN76871.1 hypothetical protein AYR47_00340 [Pseudomonas azotoformans]